MTICWLPYLFGFKESATEEIEEETEINAEEMEAFIKKYDEADNKLRKAIRDQADAQTLNYLLDKVEEIEENG